MNNRLPAKALAEWAELIDMGRRLLGVTVRDLARASEIYEQDLFNATSVGRAIAEGRTPARGVSYELAAAALDRLRLPKEMDMSRYVHKNPAAGAWYHFSRRAQRWAAQQAKRANRATPKAPAILVPVGEASVAATWLADKTSGPGVGPKTVALIRKRLEDALLPYEELLKPGSEVL